MSVLGGLELIEDIAAEIGHAPSTVREWCRRGEFPNIRYPGKRRVLIPRSWADAYLAGDCELVTDHLPNGGRAVHPKGVRLRAS